MIINESKVLKAQHKPRLSFKTRLILLLLLALAAITTLFYLYYQSTKQQLKRTQTLETQSKLLEQEIGNCNALLAGNQGEFAQYEYCRHLLSTFNQ